MDNVALTPFPALRSTILENEDTESESVSTEAYTGLKSSPDLVYLAWARLLEAYTKFESLTFEVDNHEAITVCAYSPIDAQAHPSFTCNSREVSTGVFFRNPPGHTVNCLWLHHDLDHGRGRLLSKGPIPPTHACEIGCQLGRILYDILASHHTLSSKSKLAKTALSMINESPQPSKSYEYLHEMVDRYAKSEQVAISHLGAGGVITEMSYETFVRKSRSLAARLQKLLHYKNDTMQQHIVPILVEQSPELYIGQLAVSYAGAAFCPIPYDAPVERVKFILEDVEAGVILTSKCFASSFSILPIKLILVEDEDLNDHEGEIMRTVLPNPLCYVMYTSGSTGKPKGVKISHSAVMNSLAAHEKYIPHFRRFLQFAAPTFDVSIFEIFFTFMRRATLVCCDRLTLFNDFVDVLNRLNVDAAELTPTVASTLLRHRDRCPDLRLLLTIGEMLSQSLIEEFGDSSNRKGVLYAMYGPTEAGIHCTLQPLISSRSIRGNIGLPLDTVSVFVASEDPSRFRILPLGHVGELVLGGYQLADGYLNQDEQAGAVFIETEKYGRLYRTGDRARILPSRTIECLGRVNEGQVKLRGQRMELGEVEAVAMRSSDINLAVADILDDQIVLFCSTSGESTDSVARDIDKLCRAWLPEFMIPSNIEVSTDLPRLASGKTDRKRMRTEYQSRKLADASYSCSSDHNFEMVIDDTLRDILGRRLTHSEPFKNGGVDSLRAISFASELARRGLKAGANDITSMNSIRRLADFLRSRTQSEPLDPTQTHNFHELCRSIRDTADLNIVLSQNNSVEHVFPCSPLQNAMLVETGKRYDAYWNQIELKVAARAVDVRSIWHQLALRNDVLRSGFVSTSNAQSPYARIVWRQLEEWQIYVGTGAKCDFQGYRSANLLHPLQIRIDDRGPFCVLEVEIHHALFDGWSWDCLMSDLAKILKDEKVPERGSYLSYVASVYNYLSSEDVMQAQRFWQRKLSDRPHVSFPSLTSTKTNTPRCSIHVTSKITLPALQNASENLGIHPQAFFLAAFSLLWSKYVGSTNFILGIVAAGRTLSLQGIESVVGPCIATLPLSLAIDHSITVWKMSRNIQREIDEVIQQSNIPLTDIRRAAEVAPHENLFDVLFAWQQSMTNIEDVFEFVEQISSRDHVEQKLLLEIEPKKSQIVIKATIDPSFISEEQADLLIRQMDTLCEFILKKDSSIQETFSALPMEVLSVSNLEPSPIALKPISYPVEVWAEDDPNRLAVEFLSVSSQMSRTSTRLTYGTLNTYANWLASVLSTTGIKSGDVVCVLLNKCTELYVAALAIAKLGAVYLPVVPGTPTLRITQILDTSQTKLILVQSSSQPFIRSLNSYHLINVSEALLPIRNGLQSIQEYRGTLELDNISYLIFTSGSTGRPKGVPVTQRNLASNLAALDGIYPSSNSDSRMLQSSSQSFDLSLFEIFFAWHRGMCLVSSTKDILFHDIEGFIQASNVTHLSMTPTMASMVDPLKVPNVEFLVTAGEPMTEYLQQKWGDDKLYNGYGPSETTNICTVKLRMSPNHVSSLVGQPLRNSSAFVLEPDSDFVILPKGAIGELCFGGDQVFEGYLEQPDQTRTKLICHGEHGKIFRSGDLGVMLADGELLCIGRIDDQVKIRGLRVELGEVNCAVETHEAVNQCVTALCADEASKGNYLASFWTDSRKSDIHDSPYVMQQVISDIFDHVLSVVPGYMCPGLLVPIKMIPRTSNGKVDYKNLRSMVTGLTHNERSIFSRGSEVSTNNDFDDKLTKTESCILEQLSVLLSIPCMSIKKNMSFYGLGLDSISAISLARRLRDVDESLNVEVSEILRHPTTRRLASHLDQTGGHNTKAQINLPSLEDLLPTHVKGPILKKYGDCEAIVPCTPLQTALLSASSSSDINYYWNCSTLHVQGSLKKLKSAWSEAMHRQPILRTHFVSTAEVDQPYLQVIVSNAELPWEETTQCDNRNDDTNGRVIFQAVDSHDFPFKLQAITCPDSRSELILHMHHALYDGIAIRNLLKEVEYLYHGLTLPPLVPFYPFIQHILALDKDAADRYWTRHLENYEPSPFPNLTGKSNKVRKLLTGFGVFESTLGTNLSDVKNASKAKSATLLSICQTAWVKILQALYGLEDVCFGNVMSCRTLSIEGLDRMIAPCFNTLPVRVRLEHNWTNEHLATRLNQINAEHMPYQLTSLRRIQSRFGSEGQRLFDTLFILQNNPVALDSHIWRMGKDNGTIDFPLVCEVTPIQDKDALHISLHYERSFLLENDAHLIFNALEESLNACIDSPSASALEVCTSESPLCATSNNYPLKAKNSALLHAAFEANAESRPEAHALEFAREDDTVEIWTYRQLNEKANRIAQHLRSVSVTHEEAIPIYLHKCPLFYAVVLGVLKAGAAFTPVDPDTPADRKQYMLKELGAKIIITTTLLDVSWFDGEQVDVSNLCSSTTTRRVETQSLPDSSLAYRLYTSGSTGRPKAVCVEHRHATTAIGASGRSFPWSLSSRLLQYAAITFDMCYYDCFLAWTHGFCLCAAAQSTMFSRLQRTINTVRASHLDLTPSVASLIEPSQVPSVEILYCIGEAMPQSLVEKWPGKCLNSYGPTETSMCVTIFSTNEGLSSSVIGKPFESTQFLVKGKGDFTAPVLGVGELLIGGSQVARGYHANDELTQRQFIHLNGQRFYRSGDKVRQLGNGSYEFIIRLDDQVKIRGLRVELDEIKTVMQQADGRINGCSVQVFRAEATSRDQLVGFFTSKLSTQEVEVIRRKLFAACEARLPEYMIPSIFISIDQIPLSPAGKLDKRQLLKIFKEQNGKYATTEGSMAFSESEHLVRNVMSQVSNVQTDKIQRNTTIFHVGLDSISAIQLASTLQNHGLTVSATDIMRSPTVAGIASQATFNIAHHQSKPSAPRVDFDFNAFETRHLIRTCERYGLKRAHCARLRPCSSFQAGIVSQFIHSKGAKYFNHNTLKFKSKVSGEDIRDAMDVLFEKHEILRSGFVSLNDAKHPFGMLTYRARAIEPLIRLDKSDEVSVIEWRRRATELAYSNTHQLLWTALIKEANDSTLMHLSVHHGLYDAISLQLILNDLDSVLSGQLLSFETPEIDAVLSDMISPSISERRAENFWRSYEGKTPISKFPNLNPENYTAISHAYTTRRSNSSFSDLEDGCRRLGVSMGVACQATWARLLSAYTGESHVTFGNVLSGRTSRIAMDVVFPCITTVPICVNASSPTKTLLSDLTAFNSEVRSFQFTPLTKVQRWTNVGEVSPFDTLFIYQSSASKSVPSTFEVDESSATVEYSVSIEIEHAEDDNRLIYRLAHQTGETPENQALVMLDQFDADLCTVLFGGVARRESSPPNLLSFRQPKDRSIQSEVSLVHEFVERSAQRSPQNPAFEFVTAIQSTEIRKDSWNYLELDQQGNRIANFLTTRGVHQQSVVAVCFEKCPEASFAMLGILKAGCGFLAIDPGAPPARKIFMVNDSKAATVLTTLELTSQFKDDDTCPVIAIDAVDLKHVPANTTIVDQPISPSDTCYYLYTSGTTGTPKGVVVTHENVVQAMMAFRQLFKWNERSRWLQFAAYHFDVAVMEQYWTWSVGLCLVGAPRDLIFEDLAGMISKLQITHIDLTPSLAQTLNPSDVPTLCHPDSVFITGGEALKEEIIAQWGKYQTIYNGYGPTEATIGCTMYPRVPMTGKSSNIGWQFDNVGTAVIRSGTTKLVVKGAVGELCVFGPLVAKGYLNRPEKTAESFQEIDIAGRKELMYRTGDLVRMLANGSFAYIGRADDQVKIRGQRIETREINSVVKKSHSTVTDVTTMKLRHPKQRSDQLVAFFCRTQINNQGALVRVLYEESSEVISIIRKSCEAHLPRFAVPTHFIPINFFPLTANNKTNSGKLREIFSKLDLKELQTLTFSREDDSESSFSKQEQKIANIIRQYVHSEYKDVRRSSTIFALGLDSVSVIGFTQALKDAGFAQATTSLVMEHASIGSIAEALGRSKGYTTVEDGGVKLAKQMMRAYGHRYWHLVADSLGVDQGNIESIAPCTPLQQGMISRVLKVNSPIYFADFRFELASNIDQLKLQKAWERVVEKVQILRTRFVSTDDGYIQVVLKYARTPWRIVSSTIHEYIDVSLEAEYMEWWSQNNTRINEPVEIVVGSSSMKSVLVLHIFHALYDATSLSLLLDAVKSEYCGMPMRLAPDFHYVLPYGPLLSLSGAEQFWKYQLQQRPNNRRFPSIASDPTGTDAMIKSTITVPTGMETLRRTLNVTHQAIMQACWVSVLNKSFGPVTVGLIVSGRSLNVKHADRTIGPLFNTIPFFASLSGSATWKSVTLGAHAFNVAALPYQHTPLKNIMKWVQSPGETISQPLFENLFSFQKQSEQKQESSALWNTSTERQRDSDYPLALDVEQLSDVELRLTLASQGWLAGEGELKILQTDFESALTALINNPDATVSTTFGRSYPNREDELNGYAKVTNGKVSYSSAELHSSYGFQWSNHTLKIRDEIANLCEIPSESVGAFTSILELGLDSIDAVKLSSRLKNHANLKLSISQIMRTLSVAKMFELLSNEDILPSGSAHEMQVTANDELDKQSHCLAASITRTRLDPAAIERTLPATPLQEAMIAEMHSSRFKRYFNHDVLQLHESVDLEKLKQAWQTVVDQNPILRTSFVEVEANGISSTFAQAVHHCRSLSWREETLSGSEDTVQNTLDLITEDLAGSARDQIPLRLTLVKFARDKSFTYLIVSLSHALYDGWSLALLHEDVQHAYEGKTPRRPPIEPILANALRVARDSNAKNYWQTVLSNLTPTIFTSQATPMDSEQTNRSELTSSLQVTALHEFCKANHVSIPILTQTCFTMILAYLTGQLDVAFGMVLSCRDTEESERVMFPTMNTVAFRSILHGSKLDMLKYAQENMNRVREFSKYPLRKALATVQSERSTSRLFDALFLFQKRLQENVSNTNNKLYNSITSASAVEYPLAVEAEVIEDSLVWRNACRNSFFDVKGTRNVLVSIDEVLQSIYYEPNVPCIGFEGTLIRICGLPSFSLATKMSMQGGVDAKQEETTQDLDEPDPEMLAKVRDAIKEVAKLPETPLQNNSTVFSLGLDSISTIKVSTLLRKQNIAISVSDILKAATPTRIASSAKWMEDDNEGGNSRPSDSEIVSNIMSHGLRSFDMSQSLKALKIQDDEVEFVLPTTPGQTYMLQLHTTSGVFQPKFKYQLQTSHSRGREAALDSITRAWNHLMRVTPILRTLFISTGQRNMPFVQVVLTPHGAARYHTSNSSFSLPEASVYQLGIATPFVKLFASRSNASKFTLRLEIHHALYDGVSLPLLIERLESLLISPAASPEPTAHSLETKFCSFIAATLEPTACIERRRFWAEYLDGLTSETRYSSSKEAYNKNRVEFFAPQFLSASSVQVLQQQSRHHNLTLHSLFLAAYTRAYAQSIGCTKDEDVITGLYVANRAHGQVSDLVAPTLNILPLRTRKPLGGHTSLPQLASQIQRDVQTIIESAGRSNVSLADIYDITQARVVVESSVNFLALPHSPPRDKGSDTRPEAELRLEEIGHDENANGYARVVDAPQIPREGEDMTAMEGVAHEIRAAYRPSLDVEAKVTEEGALAVGVFCDEGVMGLEDVRALVAGLKGMLEALVGE